MPLGTASSGPSMTPARPARAALLEVLPVRERGLLPARASVVPVAPSNRHCPGPAEPEMFGSCRSPVFPARQRRMRRDPTGGHSPAGRNRPSSGGKHRAHHRWPRPRPRGRAGARGRGRRPSLHRRAAWLAVPLIATAPRPATRSGIASKRVCQSARRRMQVTSAQPSAQRDLGMPGRPGDRGPGLRLQP
jgi:hypothetical protein